jgi:hypothetical protein
MSGEFLSDPLSTLRCRGSRLGGTPAKARADPDAGVPEAENHHAGPDQGGQTVPFDGTFASIR